MGLVRDIWVRTALGLSLALIVYFLAAALGTKFGLMPWTLGFGQMTLVWGQWLMIGTAAFAAIAFLLALTAPPRRLWLQALVALLIPTLGLGYGVYVERRAKDIPPIHDISTDVLDPPAFSQGVIDARASVPSVEGLDLLSAHVPEGPRAGPWAGMRVTEVQQAAYPEIESIPTGLSAGAAFDHALELARAQGWRFGVVDRDGGRIEATSSTFWFGFTDDIVIRIRPDGTGARIDMRSVSRVGSADHGANAGRMGPYLNALRERLVEAES
jgi:uncharacterized protein (DUF1499 family)